MTPTVRTSVVSGKKALVSYSHTGSNWSLPSTHTWSEGDGYPTYTPRRTEKQDCNRRPLYLRHSLPVEGKVLSRFTSTFCTVGGTWSGRAGKRTLVATHPCPGKEDSRHTRRVRGPGVPPGCCARQVADRSPSLPRRGCPLTGHPPEVPETLVGSGFTREDLPTSVTGTPTVTRGPLQLHLSPVRVLPLRPPPLSSRYNPYLRYPVESETSLGRCGGPPRRSSDP